MIDPVAIQIGPFAIHWYALCIMTGLVLAVYLSSKEAPRKKMTSDDVIDFIIIAFPIAIIGARLYYVIFEWSYYSKHLNELLAIWNGGIAIYGGLITGAIVLFIYCYYKVLNPIRFLDIIAPGVMLAQAIGRWGNFINQEAYGRVVKALPYLPKKKLLLEGEVLAFYLIWYGIGRFVIEGMRTDSLIFIGLRVSQIVSIVLIILGIVFVILRRRQKGIPYYQE